MDMTFEVFLFLLENEPLTNREIADRLDTDIRNVQRAVSKLQATADSSILMRKYFDFKEDGKAHTISQRYALKTEQISLLTKLLLSSRSLNGKEMAQLINSMLKMINLKDRKAVTFSVDGEIHTQATISDTSLREKKLWEIDQYVLKQKVLRFDYTNKEIHENPVTETIERVPVHTFFDNFYFFMVGWNRESQDKNPYEIYRIDWMDNLVDSKITLNIDHKVRLNHGQQALQRAYGYKGEEIRIKFDYYGYIGYVKDKFPSCEVIKRDLPIKNQFDFPVNRLEIKVNYSGGVKLWLLGQAPILRVVSPKSIADDIRDTLKRSYELYEK